MDNNPLLRANTQYIPFDEITPTHITEGVPVALATARERIQEIIHDEREPTYENFIAALDQVGEDVMRAAGVAHHLISVVSNDELREAFNAVLPQVLQFQAEYLYTPGLWDRYEQYANTTEAQNLDPVRKRHLELAIKGFERNGIHLPAEQQARINEIRVELGQLSTKFAENVLDSTNAYELIITDEDRLSGIPENALEQAKQSAEQAGKDGWRFTLQMPSFIPVLRFADDRSLREEMYEANTEVAVNGEHDNGPLVQRILALRKELANMLGYEHFADYQTELRMVGNGAKAIDFVEELHDATVPYFAAEVTELSEFAAEEFGIETIQPWDVAYVSEKLRQKKFSLDSEKLRPYFPLEQVKAGMFALTEQLFGGRVEPVEGVPVWHEEVETYKFFDENDHEIGLFYIDWFPRESKRSGAWMNSLYTGARDGSAESDPHVGLFVCNFTPPNKEGVALLTHDEVLTALHEFGHLLHHMFGRSTVKGRSGMNVAWDFVELPSQIMENWAYTKEGLALLSKHWKTGEVLPDEYIETLQKSYTFAGGHMQMRQLSFGIVDLMLHTAYDPSGDETPTQYANRVVQPYVQGPEFVAKNRLETFQHLFAGGYGAGYYSYKWAEVLDADAFARFEEEGVMNGEVGRAFRDEVLAAGDTRPVEESFRKFRGRDPDVQALIQRNLG